MIKNQAKPEQNKLKKVEKRISTIVTIATFLIDVCTQCNRKSLASPLCGEKERCCEVIIVVWVISREVAVNVNNT